MELHEWLDLEDGRAAWLAAQLDKSRAAVSLWRKYGVPLTLIEQISELTGGAATQEAMLRHAMRCKAQEQQKRAADPAAQEPA